MEENIKFIDGIRIVRLFDGKWVCFFNDYRTYKTSKLSSYSIWEFEKWCFDNNVIPIKS